MVYVTDVLTYLSPLVKPPDYLLFSLVPTFLRELLSGYHDAERRSFRIAETVDFSKISPCQRCE